MEIAYNHFLVACSFLISVAGSFMALLSARQAIASPSPGRKRAIMLSAAVALGGVGIWSMHFVAMLALSIERTPVDYDALLTVASLLVAVAVTYAGFLAIRYGMPGALKLLGVGFIMGTGVTAMHYTGMLAMRLQADIVWNWEIVLLSYAIAVVASIVALWLASNLRRWWQMLASAVVMGMAVCGMHYTGMFAASFVANPAKPRVLATPIDDLVFAGLIVILAGTILVSLGVINAFLSTERQLSHVSAG